MIPIKAIRLTLGTLAAADTTYLAAAAAMKVALVKASFVPTELLILANLTLATFTGSAAKAGVAGAQGTGVDPATGNQIITVLPPATGWRWVCTAAPTPAETIYGYVLTDNAGAVLLATGLLPTPITIANVSDQIDLGDLQLTINVKPIS